ncbi:stalk domain-containing protein [Paenibacillus gorillae]|uniref:stalk domain-containing protein n=1 Tax=Paenibacillus gorillae TaxID=1243662 RepID=UPI0004B60670|nr:copper amine oxidase N-terminal domain-containing protein [Paenibacillus gorillae]
MAGFAAAIGLVPLLHAAPIQAAAQKTEVKFQLNVKSYTNNSGVHTLAAAPFILHNTTMVPLRALTESLGGTIQWNEKSQTATLSGGSYGKLTIKVNDSWLIDKQGNKLKLPEKVVQTKGMIFVPVRNIARAMGAKVAWNESAKTIAISSTLPDQGSKAFRYSFDKDQEGWSGDFADLPVKYDKTIYELAFAREAIPGTGSSTPNYGLKLKGMNRSDDLFMFLTKKVDGLAKNTTYNAKLEFAMYTNEAGEMMGVGGAPGESVFIKAGVVATEPKTVQSKDTGDLYYRMNVDKGNQGTDGKDMKLVGNAVKPDSGKEGYQRKNFTYNVKVKSDSNGQLFIIIGSDSGYEGLSTLYFDDISLTLTP